MSSPLGASTSNPNPIGLPRGELLGRYGTYLDAQKVVDYLADNDFPVANLTIVGNDLKSVERVTAKLSYPKVAAAGAAQGAMFGVFVGLVLTIFSPGSNALAQILSSVGIGMAIWMVVGVVGYSFRRGKRDFASQSQVLATSYDVVVAFSHAHAARAIAAKLPMSRTAADNGVGAHQPPVQPPAPARPSAPATPADPAKAQGVPTSGSYSDLPDGRPQFGVRLGGDPQPVAAPAPETPAPETPAAPAPEGTGTPQDTADADPDSGPASGPGDSTAGDATDPEHRKHL